MATEKERMLDEIEKAWRELQDALDRVPPDRMEEGGVVEKWSVKDIMGHFTTWEDYAMTAMSCFLRDRDTELLAARDVDAYNARTSDAKTSVPLKSIAYDFHKSHDRIVESLKNLSEEEYGIAQVIQRVSEDTHVHYREHAAHILEWLEEKQRE